MKNTPSPLLYMLVLFFLLSCENDKESFPAQAADILKEEILKRAEQDKNEPARTLTEEYCERSAGGMNDFYSEGDYWWPNPEDPEGPYIVKDGLTNPGNFTLHRELMIRFSQMVGNLCSAYLLNGNKEYSDAITKHLKAWFITDSTRMNPHLLYAQAIKGRHTGRGIGIIDAIHLIEVARTVIILEEKNEIEKSDLDQIKSWFSQFNSWLTSHEYGLAEMVHPNNHGTCWNMQVGIYAKLTGNDSILDFCRENYKTLILPNQMAVNGSFPLELNRTKPYGYSLFNLDAMVMNCLILSDPENDLWNFTTEDGKNIEKGLEYMAAFVADKSSWPLKPDVMYWENWPVAHPAFIFGAIQFNNEKYFKLWEDQEHFPEVKEVIRNLPVRNPLIWLD